MIKALFSILIISYFGITNEFYSKNIKYQEPIKPSIRIFVYYKDTIRIQRHYFSDSTFADFGVICSAQYNMNCCIVFKKTIKNWSIYNDGWLELYDSDLDSLYPVLFNERYILLIENSKKQTKEKKYFRISYHDSSILSSHSTLIGFDIKSGIVDIGNYKFSKEIFY